MRSAAGRASQDCDAPRFLPGRGMTDANVGPMPYGRGRPELVACATVRGLSPSGVSPVPRPGGGCGDVSAAGWPALEWGPGACILKGFAKGVA